MPDGWKRCGRLDARSRPSIWMTDYRLQFYSSAYVETGAVNHLGQPEFRKAMNDEQACLAAMQGLSHACYSFWPDCVLFISAFFVNAGMLQLISSRRHKVVLHHTESPLNLIRRSRSWRGRCSPTSIC